MALPGQWKGMTKGTRVWVRSPEEGWRQGTLAAAPAAGTTASCSVALDSELGEGTGPVVAVPLADLAPANPTLLDGASDVTHLSYLNEPGILNVLRQRYAGDAVYTAAGPVLLAVNPFRPLPLYGPDAARHYSQRGASSCCGSTSSSSGLTAAAAADYQPHVFLTADRAFKQMVADRQSQSVLITGESGAGKTETCKIMMRYLAQLAGGTGMEDRVLESHPLLEAFGNAKTVHNNNSSRFGKLIEIYFNSRGHGICGALIHTYLLEKSRVVHQQPGERSYHIFYQLCRGASEAERERYQLPASLDSFAYLRSSGCTSIARVDDDADFAAVKAALGAVGIGEEQQASLFALLAAVLWLGNVQFRPLHDDAVTVEEDSLPAVRAAAGLLQCGEGALLAALTTRRMQAGGEHITCELSMDAALDNRDALSKAIYAALFKWLVQQINAALAAGKQRSDSTTLSILDIYGFEQFQDNSFEQLCINFANERLQQQFSKHMFRLEQEVYDSEGIDWAHIEFADNQDCVDLIEARPPAGVGILSMLDEECMMPKGTDSTFAAKLRQHHSGHPRFGQAAGAAAARGAPGDDFTVQHYAGPVTYSAAKFLDKNRDTLSKDLVALLQASRLPLVQLLAGEMAGGERGAQQGPGDRKGSQTVGARFRDQLRDLVQRLDATTLHYIRCIKPNSQQVAGRFDAGLVLHQLRCCGVLEVARIAAAGYPTRYLHTEFAARYRELLPELGSGRLPAGVDALDVCKRLLAHFSVEPSQYQIGRSKLFFRAGVLGQLEDAAARMQRSALHIQSTWRMVCCRRAFLRARAAATCIQAHWRGRRGRLLFADLLRQHRAAAAIQAAVRGHAQRRRYRRALRGVVAIQMAWRRHILKGRVAARLAERRRAEAAQQAVTAAKQQEEETFKAIQRDFGVDAGDMRRVLGLWQEHGEAFMQWHQQPCASSSSQAAAAAPAPPATDDSGLLLEAAAAGVDAQQRWEGLQAYAHKLERNVDDLREENELLHRAVQTLQQAVDQTADHATSAHCQAVLAHAISPQKQRQRPPRLLPAGAAGATAEAAQLALSSSTGGGKPPLQSHFSVNADSSSRGALQQGLAAGVPGGGSDEEEDSDGDTISLMSLNDGDSFTTDSQSLGAGASTPTAASLTAAREEGSTSVTLLNREFAKKTSLFGDDAEFILEVRSGQAEAPGMNPELEMQRLMARYKAWKKEFKERLGSTQRSLKQLKREERRVLGVSASGHSSGSAAGSGGGGAGRLGGQPRASGGSVRSLAGGEQGGADGSLTSRTSRMLSHLRRA